MKAIHRLPAIVVLLAGAISAQSNLLTVTPSPLILCGQPGQAISNVPITISSASGSVDFVTSGFTSEGNWLIVDPSFATATPDLKYHLVLGIAGGVVPFATGLYNGQVILSNFDGTRLGAVPVILQVSAAGCGPAKTGQLFSSSGPIEFQLLPGASSGAMVSLYNLSSSTVTVIPTTSTNWLSTIGLNLNIVSGISLPTPLGIGVNTKGLGAGSYTGIVDLNSSNVSTLDIPVTLAVNPSAGSAQFAVSPSPLALGIPLATATTSADIQVTNLNSSPVSINVTSDQGWLSAVSSSTAAIQPNATVHLTTTITTASLAHGANQGHLNIQSSSGGSMSIPVTVTYGIDAPVAASPNPVNLTLPTGATAQVDRVVSVSTTSSLLSFSTKTFSSVNHPWLTVSPYYATVQQGKPVNLTISVQPSLLPSGPAVGVITLIQGDGSTAATIVVNVNAGTDTSVTLTPAQLSFTYQTGGALPQAQTLSLKGTPPAIYSAQAIGSWLSVSPTSLNTSTPASLTVQANPSGLAPGLYTGQVVITNVTSGAQQVVPVTFQVGAPLAISATPAALTFQYQTGASTMPPAQTIQLSSTGTNTPFSVTAASFLTVTPSSGSTPANLNVALNPAALPALQPGQYPGVITIASPGLPSQTVNVTLVISRAAPPPSSIVNAATLTQGAISPGEVVSIFGSGFGLPEGVVFSLTPLGLVPTTLAGVTLTFDSYPAPLLYVGSGQINAIVPYEIAGRSAVQVVITRNGASSSASQIAVTDTAPGIFSNTQTGSGQGAILNADNSYNSTDNPAARGTVIQIFGTGEGQYPAAASGSITTSTPPFPVLSAPVTLTIGGVPAQILYAGEAPGLISGVMQVNAVIPAGIGSGPQPVVLTVGTHSNAAQGITVAVR